MKRSTSLILSGESGDLHKGSVDYCLMCTGALTGTFMEETGQMAEGSMLDIYPKFGFPVSCK